MFVRVFACACMYVTVDVNAHACVVLAPLYIGVCYRSLSVTISLYPGLSLPRCDRVYVFLCVRVFVCTCFCVYVFLCVRVFVCTCFCVYVFV